MSAVIQTHELTKRYLHLFALDRMSLEVQEGFVYALVGPNAAGKTTSIKIFMNLIAATSGQASVLGLDSQNIRGKSFRQIGYVSENQEIPEWMKVRALLENLRELYPTWDRQLESSLLKQFDLPRDRKIKALSRGMKMKLALASALAFHPKLIVLDEPFGGLDPLVRDQLIEGLLERASEATILLASHDLAEIFPETLVTLISTLEKSVFCCATAVAVTISIQASTTTAANIHVFVFTIPPATRAAFYQPFSQSNFTAHSSNSLPVPFRR